MPKKKAVKRKAYLIVHDGNHILVGRGGKTWVGARKGNHFPGGTVDRKESLVKAALRELKEEMQINDINESQLGEPFKTNVEGMENVNFFSVKVSDVHSYAKDVPQDPINKDQNDTPFAECVVLSLDQVGSTPEDFFSEEGTDWFREGIKYAINVKKIKDDHG